LRLLCLSLLSLLSDWVACVHTSCC
jgi:hypothetical protein